MCRSSLLLAAALTFASACAPQIVAEGESEDQVSSTDEALTDCRGPARRDIPNDETYVLTTFGTDDDPDTGTMSCGTNTRGGSWFYMASRQRFGCGAHVMLCANNKCAVAQSDDYGPARCVDAAAGRPVIDASPMVAKYLFGLPRSGWKERRLITAVVVPDSTPLGPINPTGAMPPAQQEPAQPMTMQTCPSATRGGEEIPLQQCVQSRADSLWYQCTGIGWVKLYSNGSGYLGDCTQRYPLTQ